MEHSLGWVAQCKQSVEALQSDTKQATFHRARCCQVLAAALAAQLAVEHAVHKEGLTSRQSQALQQLCASTFAGIELAQQCIQVIGEMRLLLQDNCLTNIQLKCTIQCGILPHNKMTDCFSISVC